MSEAATELEQTDHGSPEGVLVLAQEWRAEPGQRSDIRTSAAVASVPRTEAPKPGQQATVHPLRLVSRVPQPPAPGIDEARLREMVAEIVREELRGSLGQRLTGAVRKLVRAEVARIPAVTRSR